MGFSTFSGPVRSGTVRDGTVTTRNTGLVILSQSATVGFASMTTSPTAQNLFTLPAGAKIVNFWVEKSTAISGGSVSAVNLTIGKTGTADAYLTSTAIGLTTARTTQAVIDAQFVTAGCNNIGTTDVTVTGTFTAVTGNPTAGEVVVTVSYVQRLSDGTAQTESGE
jgi:hypothetical protein